MVPAALAAGAVAAISVHLWNQGMLTWASVDPASALGKLALHAMPGAVFGAVVVMAGCKVAPAGGATVPIGLAGLVLVLAGGAIAIAVAYAQWWPLVTWLCVIAGAVVAAYSSVEQARRVPLHS
jgi:hypothetical protein